jgi:Host cell surface-exposed lipoprotein
MTNPLRKGAPGILGLAALAVLAGCGSLASPGSGVSTTQTQSSASSSPAATTPAYTAAQQQAIDAAENYLTDGQGFSRKGLIQQLHSPDGNGFSRHLAVFAVDHVKVSWDRQAAIAAKAYVSDGQGFSYSGLVQQLESPYGNDFTYAQAVYGAKKAGL